MTAPDHTDVPVPETGLSHGPRRHAAAIVLVLATALAVRVALVLATPGYHPGGTFRVESGDYDRHAASIAAGLGYPDSWVNELRREAGVPVAGFVPTAHRLPLFPYGLAAIYRVAGDGPAGWRAARLLQAAGGTLVVGLLGLVAFQVFGFSTAIVAMAFGAIYPPLVVFGTGLLSEPLFLALELAAVLAVLAFRRSKRPLLWAAAAGALAGLAILARLNGAVVLLFVVAGLWIGRPLFRPRSMLAPALAVGSAILIVTPWAVRNARATDAFVPIATGNGIGLAGTYNERVRTAGCQACWQVGVPEVLGVVFDPGLDEVEVDRVLLRQSLNFIGRHPVYPAVASFWNAGRFIGWVPVDSQEAVVRFSVGEVAGARAMGASIVAGTWILNAAVLIGVALGAHRGAPRVLWLLPLLFALTLLPVVASSRYRLPADAVFLLVGSAGAVRLWERMRARSAPTEPSPSRPPPGQSRAAP